MSVRTRFSTAALLFLALFWPGAPATAAPPDRFDFSFTVTSDCDPNTVVVEGQANSDNKFQNGSYWQRYNLIGTGYRLDDPSHRYVFRQQENYRLRGSDVFFSSSFRVISKGPGSNLLIKYMYTEDGMQFDGQARCVG